jgi:hypothetical protein
MNFESSTARHPLRILAVTAFAALVAADVRGQAPPADAGYPATGPISGYMDFHFNKPEADDAVLDFHRFVLILNHSFSPRIRFVGELEVEHAFVEGLEESGEVELEQAYVDFLVTRAFNVRAGMLLVPMGIINERHEPPVYQGVERPFVDTFIIPTTWFDTGAGVHGELPHGLRYRAYVMAPLNALEFSADEGIRNGSQKGSESNVRHAALAARAEYVGVPGLTIAGSTWTGTSNFLAPRVDTAVRIAEADARYKRDRLELRSEFAQIWITDAARLNETIGQLTGVSPNIARSLRGFYGEGAYRVWADGPARDLMTFVRYENFDTQFRMPSGFLPLKQFDRDAWVVGATYYPDPDVAVKIDYVWQRNQSPVIKAPNSFNVGLGWWF